VASLSLSKELAGFLRSLQAAPGPGQAMLHGGAAGLAAQEREELLKKMA
jgi:hypothetical protein